MQEKSEEKIGVLFVLISIFFFGLQPIISKYTVETINPLFLGTMSVLIGSIIPMLILAKKGMIRRLIEKENVSYLFFIAFFGSVFAFGLFFIGAKMTSGINASLLLQSEPLYSTLLGFFILKESIGKKQLFAMFLIIIGMIVILYNGKLTINYGDILILLTPLGYQISHTIVKKVIKKIDTYVIVTSRFLYAFPVFLVLSTLFGSNQFGIIIQPFYLALILFIGISEVLGYMLWVEAIKRINLSKATTLISPYPILSIIFAWLILSELPSVYQIIGLIAVIIGMQTVGRIKSKTRK
jgi:drug/metabolite transporter (DMT)-like permease